MINKHDRNCTCAVAEEREIKQCSVSFIIFCGVLNTAKYNLTSTRIGTACFGIV